jgi:hypothetical protein
VPLALQQEHPALLNFSDFFKAFMCKNFTKSFKNSYNDNNNNKDLLPHILSSIN